MAIGIGSAIIGTFLVRTGEEADMGRLLWALRTGIFAASGLVLVGTGAAVAVMGLPVELFLAVLVGLVAGQLIGTATEYYTAYEYNPTQELAKTAETGAATIIIGGLGLGMLSTAIPILVLVAAIYITFQLAGLYGIALAAVGMLCPLGVTLASDAYGPVADNAGGIAEQAHLPARGARAHRRPRQPRQHDRRDRQGLRHRLRRPHRPGPDGHLLAGRRHHRPSTS